MQTRLPLDPLRDIIGWISVLDTRYAPRDTLLKLASRLGPAALTPRVRSSLVRFYAEVEDGLLVNQLQTELLPALREAAGTA